MPQVGKLGRHPGVASWAHKVALEPRLTNPFPYVSPESTLDSRVGQMTLPDLGNMLYGNCLVEGTLAQGADISRAYRIPYDGPVVRLILDNGKDLTVTPNHAILTPRGFIRACQLQKGDDVVSASFSKGDGQVLDGRRSRDLHFNQAPAPIEEIWGSLASVGSSVARADYFHGDGGFMYGDVNVVAAYGELDGELYSSLGQPESQQQIPPARQLKRSLHGQRASFQGRRPSRPSGPGRKGRGGDSSPFLRSHGGISPQQGLAITRTQLPLTSKEIEKLPVGNAVLLGQPKGGLALSVAVQDIRQPRSEGRILESSLMVPGYAPRTPGYASASEPSPEGLRTDPELFSDLVERFPGQVQVARVVDIELQAHRGHVYDLSTGPAWYVANGIVTHNCVFVSYVYTRALYLWLAGVLPPGDWDPLFLPSMDDVLTAYFTYEGSPNPTDYAWSEANGYDMGCDQGDALLWFTKNSIGPLGPIEGGFALLPGNAEGQLYQGAMQEFGVVIDDIIVFQEMMNEFDSDQPWSATSGTMVGAHSTACTYRSPEDGYTATWCLEWPFTWPNRRATIEQGWVFWPDLIPNPRFDQAQLVADIEELAGTLGIAEGVGRPAGLIQSTATRAAKVWSVLEVVEEVSEDVAKIAAEAGTGDVAGAVAEAIEDIEEIAHQVEDKPAEEAPKAEDAPADPPVSPTPPAEPLTPDQEAEVQSIVAEDITPIEAALEDGDPDGGQGMAAPEPPAPFTPAEEDEEPEDPEPEPEDARARAVNPNEQQQMLAAGGVAVDEKGRPIGVPFERD